MGIGDLFLPFSLYQCVQFVCVFPIFFFFTFSKDVDRGLSFEVLFSLRAPHSMVAFAWVGGGGVGGRENVCVCGNWVGGDGGVLVNRRA